MFFESSLDRDDALYLAPLGGLGEIGMNIMVLIYRKRAILIDCGLMFPDAAHLGIDLIVPNIQFLKDAKIKIEGIVLTHGHEDHIGSVAFLLDDLGCPPIYGTPFTVALVEDRLREQGKLQRAKIRPVRPPKEFMVGPFKIKPLQVTHSIVDSMGLAIQTPIGTIVHSGDFKMDSDPLDKKRIDERALRYFGKEGVLLLMSDSTNVERPGWSRPEFEVGKALFDLFKSIKQGKILVAVFASNIHRIQQIIDSARKVKRRVAMVGRSLHTNTEIAVRLKHLKVNLRDLVPLEAVHDHDPSKILMIVTGTQAEPRSALYRMSLNDHPDVKINKGDTVIMSSRHIPGNERAISHLVNNLYRRGAEVIDSDTAKVHASGHAYQEEQKALIRWVRPKFFMPVHGEYRMLVKHMRLAKSVEPRMDGIVCENGDLIELTKKSIQKVDRVTYGKIFLDEASSDMNEELLRDRRQLAFTGVVVVSLVVNRNEGRILEGPHFDVRGVNDEVDLDALRAELLNRFKEFSKEARGDDIEVEEEFRRITRRFFKKAKGVKPVVIPLIYEV